MQSLFFDLAKYKTNINFIKIYFFYNIIIKKYFIIYKYSKNNLIKFKYNYQYIY